MKNRIALPLLAILLVLPGLGCNTMRTLSSNIGACGSQIAIGTIAGLGVAILDTSAIAGDSTSTGTRVAIAGAGAVAGAAVGYAACVRANNHRREVEERFAELEAQLAQNAEQINELEAAQNADDDVSAPESEPVPGGGVITYSVEIIDHAATKVTLGGLLFETGSAVVSERGRFYIDLYAQTLAPDMALVVHGHTDDVGSVESNQALSERRAEALADIIIGAGVSRTRVEHSGFGESRPLPPPATREQNRRVELYMIPQRTTTSV